MNIMKKLVVILFIFNLFSSSFASEKIFSNQLEKTQFLKNGYLSYDMKSYKYNKIFKKYSIDVMEELDPGGDIENIKCPYGKGFITHLIFSTKYIPQQEIFDAKYKGFMCSIGEYEYENFKPVSFAYIPQGVFYDSNTSLIPNFDMHYFEYLKNEINNPTPYNYFGFIKKIKNQN